jgi:signal transduction histidine kinase/HAMP domain-containing protein
MIRALASIAALFGLERATRRSIGTTIFAAFVGMGVITGALGGYGIFVLSAAGTVVEETYDRSLMTVSLARSASFDFSQMETELLRRSLGQEAPADFGSKLDKLVADFKDDLRIVDERSSTPQLHTVIQEIRTLFARWYALVRNGKSTIPERDALGGQILDRLDNGLTELTSDNSFVNRRVSLDKMRGFTYSSLAALVLALLLSGLITFLLARRIIRPLAAAASVADRIATGAFDTTIPTGGTAETGALLRSMTVMQDSIRVMVEREKAQSRSAQTRLVDALESAREAIVLVDSDGRIVIANSQLATFFPTLAPQLEVGKSFTAVFEGGEGMAPNGERAAASRTGGSVVDTLAADTEFRALDGRWLRVSRNATQDGGFFLLLSDITEIKEREERLDQARREAVAASEAKSAFLANMSHELRTPLNAVIGFAEILASEIFGKLGNPRYREYADNIQQSGVHLLGVINNVLDFSKHQAGKLELVREKLDLAEIVNGCATMMRDQCTRAGLTLVTEIVGPPAMSGDPGKLRQMLVNLLSNSVKFTNPSGSVTMRAGAVRRGWVQLEVSDTGIGMSADQIPIAMAVFGQVDNRLARRYEGSGLGLPLAKSIVELHGGTITIDSAPGEGTTVTVMLPQGLAENGDVANAVWDQVA